MIPTVIPTEARNPRTVDIDIWPTQRIITALLAEDKRAVDAASAATAAVAELVDRALECISSGGAVHYFGAGASGRLAVADATEATPTFDAPVGMFTAHFPGGGGAIVDSRQDFEDSTTLGTEAATTVNGRDIALGITASGSTQYVEGALARARERGATTALITSNPNAPLGRLADIIVFASTGPEAITGSTRLKAGTATKVILNAFSTALMVRAGRTYSNLMVDLVATNTKLHRRAIDMLEMATSASDANCERALRACDGELPVALIHLLAGCTPVEARAALEQAGSVRAALDKISRDHDR